MKHAVLHLMLASLVAVSGTAAAADPFDTPACRAALQRLHQIEESRRSQRAVESGDGAGPAVEQARREAARRCLGDAANPDLVPATTVSPPVSISPVGSAQAPDGNPAERRSPPTPLPPRPVPGTQAPVTVTHCESAGCWTSDGRYLLRAGPDLAGPAALCSITAGVLQCR